MCSDPGCMNCNQTFQAPAPTRPMLDVLFANVLVQIELASGVGASRSAAGDLQTTITTGKTDSGNAPPPSDAPHLHYARRYAGCRTDDHRRAVISDALEELKSLRYSRKPAVDRETLEGRLMIGRDPRPARVVAYVYGFSERHVYRLRAEAKRHHPQN